jgi:predicted transglutaminase-like cysteine proteinase
MQSSALSFIAASACVATAAAHGAMVTPISRNAVDHAEIGCDSNTDTCSAKAKGNGCVNVTHPGEPCHNGQASFWYSQGCFIGCPACDHLSGRRQTDLCGLGKKATLPDFARTVNKNATRFSELDIYQHNPWSAPGSAPVADGKSDVVPPAYAIHGQAFGHFRLTICCL